MSFLPFSLWDAAHWVTIPASGVIAFLLLGIEEIGVQIPRFCDHPLLAPVGACRQCLVEIPDAGNGRGMPKPQASCTITVAEGMVVNTQATSPVADKAQQGQMEFLLINHPLDCPVCDKGGECPLQNQAMSNGRGETRFTESKRLYPKPINISANVLLDRERCVLCARCTRFSEQVAGDPFIALIERGALQQVGIYEKHPLHSYFSGNTIQICPVGALTSSAYRFRSRPFDLVSVPSVAEHDACGSAIRVDYRRGQVMRRLAGDDPEVNEEWITDKDRFAFAYGRGDDRPPAAADGAGGEVTGGERHAGSLWPSARSARLGRGPAPATVPGRPAGQPREWGAPPWIQPRRAASAPAWKRLVAPSSVRRSWVRRRRVRGTCWRITRHRGRSSQTSRSARASRSGRTGEYCHSVIHSSCAASVSTSAANSGRGTQPGPW